MQDTSLRKQTDFTGRMEKICEYCTSLRPIVYCKADSAQLCLSCDARVHSANALSSRHIRTLLCEQCKYRPAIVRCFDHKKFICRTCDRNLHEPSSIQHCTELLTSYVGNPSAMDFAALWGFELNSGSMFDAQEGQYQHENCIILQQILDFNRFGVTDLKINNLSSIQHEEEQPEMSSSKFTSFQRVDDSSDQFARYLHDISGEHNQDSHEEELKEDSFPSPFSQLEQLNENPFWQCKSPVRSDHVCFLYQKLWSQNLQDLGVCEGFNRFEDLNIPEVDLTFQNYEELFGGNQDITRALLDDKDLTFVSNSFDGSDEGSPIPSEGGSADSSSHVDKHIGQSDESHQILGSLDSPHFTQQSYPTIPSSLSRLSAESHGINSDSPDIGTLPSEARENAMMRYKEKKKGRTMNDKKGRSASQKSRTITCKRVKGPPINTDEYESDTM